jgi:hypothetical protein
MATLVLARPGHVKSCGDLKRKEAMLDKGVSSRHLPSTLSYCNKPYLQSDELRQSKRKENVEHAITKTMESGY